MRSLIALLITAQLAAAADPRVSRMEVTVPPTPGTTQILATASGGAAVLVAVTVEGVAPAPVIPPGPGPTPLPVDALVGKLQAAYALETSPKKDEFLADLIELYSQAQTFAANATVDTTGKLAAAVRDAGGKLLGKDDLAGVRKVLAAELAAAFPADVPLTDVSRKAAAATFKRLHDALVGVKK